MLTSAENQQIKELVRLQEKASERRRLGRYIAEGEKLVKELPAGQLLQLYASEGYAKTHALPETASEPVILSEKLFLKVSDTKSPQGILAVARIPEWEKEAVFRKKAPLFLFAEEIRDPGNLGTMFRLSEGAGADAVFLLGETADPFSPKTVRSAMGSLFRVPVYTVSDKSGAACDFTYEELGELCRKSEIKIHGAALSASVDYALYDYRVGTAFLIGNEAHGLTEKALGLASDHVIIPMLGKVESMNAAMASGILLFEAARQRRAI